MLCKIIFSLLISSFAYSAQLVTGLGIYSWQEKVDTQSISTQPNANASFNSFGPSIGFETLITPRYRLAGSVSYHSGSLDIIRKGSVTTSQRFNYTSYWFTGKVLYRLTRGFAVGPQMVYGQNAIKGLADSTSVGTFLSFDYELFKELTLSQSLGSVGDSQLMAYFLRFEWQF